MLGLTQLIILLYIRQQSRKAGRVEITDIQAFAKRELNVRQTDQTNITVRRLAERGLVEMLPCKTTTYIDSEENEATIAAMMLFCDKATKLAS
ncbi:MAG TPA: hypothetical protein VN081_03975 [Dongiaceae bacterium]|nr:hypothetical protein [Dongiaceae bacterium]